jgi:hypothetical protein
MTSMVDGIEQMALLLNILMVPNIGINMDSCIDSMGRLLNMVWPSAGT